MAITDKQIIRCTVAEAIRDHGRTTRLLSLADSYSSDARKLHDIGESAPSLMYINIAEALRAEYRDGKSNT